jgi:hypothetical protein
MLMPMPLRTRLIPYFFSVALVSPKYLAMSSGSIFISVAFAAISTAIAYRSVGPRFIAAVGIVVDVGLGIVLLESLLHRVVGGWAGAIQEQ